MAASWGVADVLGEVSFSEMTRTINDACAKAGRTHQLEELKLPSGDSADKIGDNGWSTMIR
ncbi:hypothetical protein IMZ48_13750 [Candidatus Bathyarchaeota archaeon]|nr:hypothetical protein [Candidatus Bathyarchaeota archaeon]